jgi:hypothetical protein
LSRVNTQKKSSPKIIFEWFFYKLKI